MRALPFVIVWCVMCRRCHCCCLVGFVFRVDVGFVFRCAFDFVFRCAVGFVFSFYRLRVSLCRRFRVSFCRLFRVSLCRWFCVSFCRFRVSLCRRFHVSFSITVAVLYHFGALPDCNTRFKVGLRIYSEIGRYSVQGQGDHKQAIFPALSWSPAL